MDNAPEAEPGEQPEKLDEPEQSASTPEHRLTRRQRRNRKKLLFFVIGGTVAALLLVAATYWFFLRDKDNQSPAKAEAGQQEQTDEPPAQTQADPTPVTFKSTKFNIELTHRKDWTLREAADGEIVITSPAVSYADEAGQATDGVFTVKVRKGVPDAMKTTIENAIAVRASEVIAYAKPTKQQRQYTNLSYVGQKKDVFNFFIVTGNAEYKAGGTLMYSLSLDSEFYLIAGGYGADTTSSLAFDSVPVGAMDSDVLTQAVKIVESLKIH